MCHEWKSAGKASNALQQSGLVWPLIAMPCRCKNAMAHG
jgi:hypothetical protein